MADWSYGISVHDNKSELAVLAGVSYGFRWQLVRTNEEDFTVEILIRDSQLHPTKEAAERAAIRTLLILRCPVEQPLEQALRSALDPA